MKQIIIEQFLFRCQELETALKALLAEPLSTRISNQIEIILQKIDLLRQNSSPPSGVYNITLLSEDYVNFCNLIVCGCNMAEYLLSLSRSNKLAKNHAQLWQKLVESFKPYLENVTAFWNT